ncbi:DNA-packaging protein [Ruminococcus sp.]|uniref:phage head-tail connector protein n=1 Tax=Ruminococcus sp. TaxID=41978 RepID=UPI00388FF97E
MLEKVKLALRISTNAYDSELNDLIEAAKLDLGVAGVVVPQTIDALVSKAIITYCKMSFGLPEDYDRLKRSYDEQKAQLSNATGYTDWEVSE